MLAARLATAVVAIPILFSPAFSWAAARSRGQRSSLGHLRARGGDGWRLGRLLRGPVFRKAPADALGEPEEDGRGRGRRGRRQHPRRRAPQASLVGDAHL